MPAACPHSQIPGLSDWFEEMIKALAIILLIGSLSIYYSNLDSESAFASILLPLTSVLSLIALALWAVCLFHKKGIDQTVKHGTGGADSFSGDGSGGGDGG